MLSALVKQPHGVLPSGPHNKLLKLFGLHELMVLNHHNLSNHNIICSIAKDLKKNIFHSINNPTISVLYAPHSFPLPRVSHPWIGTTIWSPLASGLLTGKYNDSIPDGSRLASSGYSWLQKTLQKWHEEGKIEKVRRLTTYAQEKYQCSVGQLALAWCLKNRNVSTVLLGATKTAQLEENLGALSVVEKITAADMTEINEILGNNPEPYRGYNLNDTDGYRSFETI